MTSGNQVIEMHDVSPDGRWIAYDNNLRGNMDIYRMPLAGGDPVPVTDAPGNEWNPRWSPNGRELVFMSARDGYPSVFKMGATAASRST